MSHFRLKVTPANVAILSLFGCSACPIMARSLFIIFRTVFGTLYPAYASYKAVKTKNVREYVKWMMYWIVMAFFTCTEDITDVFFAFWFPFYYELKILVLLWLLSPTTNGSSILYRKFVHPQLMKRENEIDEYIERAKADGYNTVAQLAATGATVVTRVVRDAVLHGGAHFNNMSRSYSTSDLNDRPTREYYRPLSFADGGAEILELSDDTDTEDFSLGSTSHVRKDDLSSGYSSSEAASLAQNVPSASNAQEDVSEEKIVKKTQAKQKTTVTAKKVKINPEVSPYATLPRASKRNAKKKTIN